VPGPPGVDGNTVLYGAINPVAGTGINDNFYINTATNFMYGPKAGGVWPTGVSMIGPQGPTGATGPQGVPGNTVLYGTVNPASGTGVDGNFYINTTTNFLYGPKAAGIWPAGVSLVGPQGPTGPAGAGSPSTLPPIMDGTATVGTSTNFSREDHIHPSDTSRAPFDALAFNGMQINGSFEVSQEFGFGNPVANKYVCDGWRFDTGGTMVVNAGSYPTASLAGFTKYFATIITTAQASIGAGDYCVCGHSIEGYRTARLAWGTANAQPITIGFWTNHHVTGIYGGTIRNSGSTRSYAFTYTQSVADTWQYNTVTVPGDTVGTWNATNGIGISIVFTLACGTTYTAPATNTWYSANYLGAPGQVNGVAATTAAFGLTGLIVLPGIQMPSAARSAYIMRPVDLELPLCKRYLRIMTAEGTGIAYIATGVEFWIKHDGMRASPSASATAAINLTDLIATNPIQSAAAASIDNNDADGGLYIFGNFTGLTIGRAYMFKNNTGKLKLDARL
jgi:hypothetical protein